MDDVVLINPYFFGKVPRQRLWLFPPLGLGYLASSLKKENISASIIDGTFYDSSAVLKKVKKVKPKIVGISCNVVTKKNALRMAEELKGSALLVAGGPQPSIEAPLFFDQFDVVIVDEGEKTFLELVRSYLLNKNINSIKGIAFKRGKKVIFTGKRELIEDLNEISFSSRKLFENLKYQDYWQKLFGYKSTLVMTTRGCPFSCNFCSNPVFGEVYRARSPENVIEEIREIINLGYNRLWFADDIFTLNKNRAMAICKKILQERINIEWDCLCRIDCSDLELLSWMKKAGCQKVFLA